MKIGSGMFRVWQYARAHAGVTKYQISKDGLDRVVVHSGYPSINAALRAGLIFMQTTTDGVNEVYATPYRDMAPETALALVAYMRARGIDVPRPLARKAKECAPDTVVRVEKGGKRK